MGQIQQKNPQMGQIIQQAINSGRDPQDMLRQLKEQNPNQLQLALQQATLMGVPENILAQIQNMK